MIAAIEKQGGEVKVDGNKAVVYVYLSNTRVNDAGLVHLERLTKLEQLTLFDTKVTAAGVKKLQQALPKCQIDY